MCLEINIQDIVTVAENMYLLVMDTLNDVGEN